MVEMTQASHEHVPYIPNGTPESHYLVQLVAVKLLLQHQCLFGDKHRFGTWPVNARANIHQTRTCYPMMLGVAFDRAAEAARLYRLARDESHSARSWQTIAQDTEHEEHMPRGH